MAGTQVREGRQQLGAAREQCAKAEQLHAAQLVRINNRQERNGHTAQQALGCCRLGFALQLEAWTIGHTQHWPNAAIRRLFVRGLCGASSTALRARMASCSRRW